MNMQAMEHELTYIEAQIKHIEDGHNHWRPAPFPRNSSSATPFRPCLLYIFLFSLQFRRSSFDGALASFEARRFPGVTGHDRDTHGSSNGSQML